LAMAHKEPLRTVELLYFRPAIRLVQPLRHSLFDFLFAGGREHLGLWFRLKKRVEWPLE
jgi:hypothetical protein